MSKLNKETLTLEDTKMSKDYNQKPNFKKKGKKSKFNKKWKGKELNAPEFHVGKSSQLVKDVASIPFNHMAGFPIGVDNQETAALTTKLKDVVLTYVRTFIVDWFVGISKDFRSVLNNASTDLWTFIRSRNSGATNYQASDIMINTVFAATDLYCNIAYAERFFRIVNKFTTTNRLIPKVLFTALGIDYEDFLNNIALYRGRLNQIIARANSLVIPNEFPLVDWAISQFTNIYKDRDSATGREQLYVNKKMFHHIYDPIFNAEGGGVRLMTLNDIPGTTLAQKEKRVLVTGMYDNPIGGSVVNKNVKFSVLLTIMEIQINAIISDEDTNIMFGDLIKAFGDKGNFYHVSEISDSITPIEFEYSEEILEQIHNSNPLQPYQNNWFSALDTGNGVFGNVAIASLDRFGTDNVQGVVNNIYQDAQGYLLTELKFNYAGVATLADKIRFALTPMLDTNEDNPDPVKVMNMTRKVNRFKCTPTDAQNRFAYEPESCSAMVVIDDRMFYGDVSNGDVHTILAKSVLTITGSTDVGEVYSNLGSQSYFDWCPLCQVIDLRDAANAIPIVIHADVNNVTTIQSPDLERIHNVDYLSLLGVPRAK